MAPRGRRGDPALQVAKGHPGRRKTSIKAKIAEAERIAGLLANTPGETDDILSPPSFLNDPLVAPALKVWRDYAPELRRTHRLGALHRLHFAMFCVYMGDWITASEDIRRNGPWQNVETIAGGVMERTRPVVAWREICFRNAQDLSKDFGLTPREEYALFRDQADAVTKNPGLFGDGRQRAGQSDTDEAAANAAASAGGLIGSLDDLDSEPPPGRVN